MGLGQMRPPGHRGALVELDLTQSAKAEGFKEEVTRELPLLIWL